MTGVCSTTQMDAVRSIGADAVIDYTREDFAESGIRYDVILDTAEGTATWLRADYDIRGAQAAIRDAGLPLRLAARLAEGR